MRRLIAFRCNGATLLGTLDEAPRRTGLLIVSGGNELRMGAHRGMARLAQRLAEAGYPVFRFDRRGIGDSEGENGGFETSCPDIAHAAAAFRKAAKLDRVVALGNCDAATALILFHGRAAIDALVLANPWAVETPDDLPPAAAIQSHYAARLRDPAQWRRLIGGGIDLRKAIRGVARLTTDRFRPRRDLAARLADSLERAAVPVTILVARRDNTAQAFLNAWETPVFAQARQQIAAETLDSASHSFAIDSDKQWLFDRVCAALGAPDRP